MSDKVEDVEQTLEERHKAFKLNAADVLHRAGDRQNYCSTFDQILVNAGLPVRPAQQGYWEKRFHRVAVRGEETEKDFEAWKNHCFRVLLQGVHDYGVGDHYREVLEEAGFDTSKGWVNRPVRLEGTFSIPMTVRMMDGDNVIDHIQPGQVRTALGSRSNWDHIEWKAVVTDAEQD